MSELGYLLASFLGMLSATLGLLWSYRAFEARLYGWVLLGVPFVALGLWVLSWAVPGYVLGELPPLEGGW